MNDCVPRITISLWNHKLLLDSRELGNPFANKLTTMKVAIIAVIMSLSLAGCSSMDSIRTENRQRMAGLSSGMSRHDVLAVMGTKTIRSAEGRLISNPYRTKLYRTPRHEFELLLYYTDENLYHEVITDEELTPLVIMDGKLDGWGWSHWNALVQKYDLYLWLRGEHH